MDKAGPTTLKDQAGPTTLKGRASPMTKTDWAW